MQVKVFENGEKYIKKAKSMYLLQLFLNCPLDQQHYRSAMLPGTHITHNATAEWHHWAGLSDQMLLPLEPQEALYFLSFFLFFYICSSTPPRPHQHTPLCEIGGVTF